MMFDPEEYRFAPASMSPTLTPGYQRAPAPEEILCSNGQDPTKISEKRRLDNDCRATPGNAGYAAGREWPLEEFGAGKEQQSCGVYSSRCELPAGLRRIGKVFNGLNLLAGANDCEADGDDSDFEWE
eukprot:GEMP01097260.1.p1 GENE.GEMP01097260.1~~GEMP01097260.1.p1  ORF type:complete len:127 (+),score=29.57 GEMP01097260.1:86-466(+)